jgi:hypothetical protein
MFFAPSMTLALREAPRKNHIAVTALLSYLSTLKGPQGSVAVRNGGLQTPSPYHTCFISYSNKDSGFARNLYDRLMASGVLCWFAPEDLKTGDRFRRRNKRSIHHHDKLLLILSQDSISSPWVEREVTTALEREEREKRLILVTHQDRQCGDGHTRGMGSRYPPQPPYSRFPGTFER